MDTGRSPLARALRGAPTLLLGVIVRDFSDPFFASVLEVLAVEAMARGYNIVLGHAHGRVDEELPLTTILETRHCDAVMMLGDMQDQQRLLDDLRGSTIPVVALWQGNSPPRVPDHRRRRPGRDHGRAAPRDGARPRADRVCQRKPAGPNPHRRDAYVEFMGERFGGVPEGYVQEVPNSLAGGEAALRELFELAELPTAVVTSTDLVAVGVLHAAYALGRTVPDEISVVGFDDLLLAAHTVPPLSTVHMPVAEIVGAGVQLAIDLARDPAISREPRRTVFEPSPVVRQSTAPPPTRLRRVAPPFDDAPRGTR